MNYHVQLSALIKAPTSFRLLNNPGLGLGSQEFDIAAKGDAMINTDVSNAMKIMTKVRPSGVTPLTDHIKEIYAIIESLRSSLETQGKRVVVVLATDGLPTNELGQTNNFIKDEFLQSLRSLEGLPVWLVVRLSTDEEEVVVRTNSSFSFLLEKYSGCISNFDCLNMYRTFTTVLTINWNYQWMFLTTFVERRKRFMNITNG